MPKVLHILLLKRRAGVEVMFINFLRYMKEKDPELIRKQIVFAIDISHSFKEDLEALGISYYVAKRSTMYKFRALFQIRRIINEQCIDIVYGQNFMGNFLGAMASISKNVKILCHEHGTAWTASGLTTLLTYFWTKRADLIICNANAAKVLLNKRFRVPLDKLKVIYNGIPEGDKTTPKKDGNQILFVGRLDPVKSPDTIIRSLPYLVKKLPGLKLEILGEGRLENELKQLTKELNVEEFVFFRGNVTNVNEYMAQSALLILPSVRESLGNVIIEAAFQKTMTIGTNIDGIAEVIKHDHTGILINPEIEYSGDGIPKYVIQPDKEELVKPRKIDPKMLAEAIYEIIVTKKYIGLGENASQYVREKFPMKIYYFEIINQLNKIDKR